MASRHQKKGQPSKGEFWQGWEEYLRDKEARRASSWESWKQTNEHRSAAGRKERSLRRGILSDMAHLFYCLHMLNPDQKDEGEFWSKCEEYFRKANQDSEESDGEA